MRRWLSSPKGQKLVRRQVDAHFGYAGSGLAGMSKVLLELGFTKQQAEKAVSVVFRKRLKSRQGYVSKESKRLAFDLLSEPFKNKLFDEKERLWRANRKKLALRRKFLEHKNSPFSERVLKKKK